jgi:hypothetical protein
MGISPTQSLIVIKKVSVFRDVSVISPYFLYLCTRNRTSIRYDAKRVSIIRKSREQSEFWNDMTNLQKAKIIR